METATVARISEELVIDAPPDEVWAVVAAVERQAEWFPGMTSSPVEGGVRTIGTAAGGVILEEILEVDPERRRMAYRITGPMQLEHHLGSIEVREVEGAPDACRVVYGQELAPMALTYVLAAALRDALVGLRNLVVEGHTSRGWEPGEAGGAA